MSDKKDKGLNVVGATDTTRVQGQSKPLSVIDDELQARLTAMALGESSDFESAQLEMMLSEDPELHNQYARLQRLHATLAGMDTSWPIDVDSAEQGDWRLSHERRSATLAILRGEQINPLQSHSPCVLAEQSHHHLLSAEGSIWRSKKTKWWIAGLTTAACLLLCVGLMLPYNAARETMRVAARSSRELAPATTAMPAEANNGTDPVDGYMIQPSGPVVMFGRDYDTDAKQPGGRVDLPTPSAASESAQDYFENLSRDKEIAGNANTFRQQSTTSDQSGVGGAIDPMGSITEPTPQPQNLEAAFGGIAVPNPTPSFAWDDEGSGEATVGQNANEVDLRGRFSESMLSDFAISGAPAAPALSTPEASLRYAGAAESATAEPSLADGTSRPNRELAGSGMAAGSGAASSDLPAAPPSVAGDALGDMPGEPLAANGPVLKPHDSRWFDSSKDRGAGLDATRSDVERSREESLLKESSKSESDGPNAPAQMPRIMVEDKEEVQSQLDGVSDSDAIVTANPSATLQLADDMNRFDSQSRGLKRDSDITPVDLLRQQSSSSPAEANELGERPMALAIGGTPTNEPLLGKGSDMLPLEEKLEDGRKKQADVEAGQKLNESSAAVPSVATVERARESSKSLEELSAASQAFSTFSLHVSDVSFKLAAAAFANGQWPEADKIRIEEFVNAFDYFDPLPSNDERVACQIEQAIHPFMQQRNVMRISLQTAATGRPENIPLRLTVLLDNSGSMERSDRRVAIRKAFRSLASQIKPDDRITVITFSNQPRLLAELMGGDQISELVRLIENLPSEGGTNLEAALKLALEKAAEGITPQNAAGLQNRIVLMTDGAVNLGDADPTRLSQLVLQMREAGIAFDAAGISAHELNDAVLEALTRQGDGRYYLLDDDEESTEGFARQIAGALRPAAKNVKVQVEFNPDRVGSYKLLGFEKHLLKQEDFRNDKVDAAEMAAAEAGVAMYQFEAKPDGRGDVGSVSVRFHDLATGSMVERRWPIPYEPSPAPIDRGSPRVQVATTAAMFAAKLRGDALGETVELKSLADILTTLPPSFETSSRVRLLQTMINAARQISDQE